MALKRKGGALSPQDVFDACMTDLEDYLKSFSTVPIHKISSNINDAKADIEKSGFIFLNKCTPKGFVDRFLELHFTEIFKLFPTAFSESDKEEIIKNKNLDLFQKRRSVSSGMAGFNSGFVFQHPAAKEEQPQMRVDLASGVSENVYMTQLPNHRVNVQLLAEMPDVAEFMIKLFGGSLEPGGNVPVCGWDSVKIIRKTNPNDITQPHCDTYDIDRLQAVWNADEDLKLMFVPGSHTDEFKRLMNRAIKTFNAKTMFKQHKYFANGKKPGFNPVPFIIPIITLIRKYAVAPPPNSIVIWRQRVVHMEGYCTMGSDGFGREKIKTRPAQTRIRAYIGLNFYGNDIPREARIKLGLASKRHGIVPQMYHGDNTGLVRKYIVASRSTQYLKRRQVESGETEKLQKFCEESYTEEDLIREVPNRLERILLTGVNI